MLPELMTQAISQCNTFVNLKQGLDATFMTVTLDHDGFILECNNEFLKQANGHQSVLSAKPFGNCS